MDRAGPSGPLSVTEQLGLTDAEVAVDVSAAAGVFSATDDECMEFESTESADSSRSPFCQSLASNSLAPSTSEPSYEDYLSEGLMDAQEPLISSNDPMLFSSGVNPPFWYIVEDPLLDDLLEDGPAVF